MSNFIDLTGRTIGEFTVLGREPNSQYGRTVWRCQCSCGKVVRVHKSNLGKTKSCGCWLRNKNRKRPYEAIYNVLVRVNKDKDISLTYEEFVEFTKHTTCIYCDDIIQWSMYRTRSNTSQSYNLDRKDNDGGYHKDNLVPCCSRCNRIKSNQLTYEQMLVIGELLKQWRTIEA